MIKHLPFYIPFLLIFISCNLSSKQEEAIETSKDIQQILATPPTPVKTMLVNRQVFNRELLANGKLVAPLKANLNFQAQGTILKINIQEGMRVGAGQVLAELNHEQHERDLQQAMLRQQQALLDYQDQLLRAGYQLKDTLTLNPSVLSVARLRSGLSAADLDLQKAKEERKKTILKAPFSGKIANLKGKVHNPSNATDFICTLIDDSQLEVEFQVMEQELDFVRQSKTVRLQSFSGDGQFYTGNVSSINPLVDQSGMITVKAKLMNSDGKLMEGMGVRVILEKSILDQFVIPKEAVLDRQNRKVVFTMEDGVAKWNYVDIEFENSTQFALKEGIKENDKVIYDGNFNLAHDKPVSETD